jgi:hypothetical protein
MRAVEDPDDHSPRVESQCNRTGQDCPGRRGEGKGGGKGGSGFEPLDGFCETVGWANPFTTADCGVYLLVRSATD